jgi:uncharacterized OB-fold protein
MNSKDLSIPKNIPLKEGLFVMPSANGEEAHLIGSKCTKCEHVFFPKREVCLGCGDMHMREVALSTKGKLFTWTVVRQDPPGALVKAPYALGKIQLPEGVFVFTVLTDCDFDKLKIDTEWELVIEKISEDAECNNLMAYKFHPATNYDVKKNDVKEVNER